MDLSLIEQQIINGWQRNFPLETDPFESIARQIGTTESAVRDVLAGLLQRGIVSRLGVTVRPNTVGASTLAAMRVPIRRMADVAELVSREPAVNHNYEREHAFNLWFVVTTCDRANVQSVLARIAGESGLEVLDLPLERAYHIDLGFPISARDDTRRVVASDVSTGAGQVSDEERSLLVALEGGLPVVSRPYQELARRTGQSEERCIDLISGLVKKGIVTRFGLIVRHRELGYVANAMIVWDIDDHDVDRIGALFASEPAVTLCYRRPRRQPQWPYNLFCMIHGREREKVLDQVVALEALVGDAARSHDILFSRRRFKQRGARLVAA